MRAPEDETLLNVFRKRRGVTLEKLAEILGVRTATASRYCLPPSHKNHCRPGRDPAERLREWSEDRVNIANYADAWTPESDAKIAEPDEAAS